MKFIIAVDLEGVAGVVGTPNLGLTRDNCPAEYDLAVCEAVRAVNSASRALHDAGATDVIVWDNHGSGVNLPMEAIDVRCRIMRGAFPQRWQGMGEDCSGVLLIGYHSMAGTRDGVLAHSFDSKHIQFIRVNGVEVGEIAIDAHFAGLMGVPVIFVESDRAGIQEAERFLPWARTVATKAGCGRNAALCLHPREVERQTYEQVLNAASHLNAMTPFLFDRPMTVEYRYMRMEDARAQAARDGELTDEYTVMRKLDEMALF